MVLGNFNLPSLGMRSEIAQEFMATVATVELAKLSRTQFIAVVMHPVFFCQIWGRGNFDFSPAMDRSLIGEPQVPGCQTLLQGEQAFSTSPPQATNRPNWIRETAWGYSRKPATCTD